tara:strand:- start:411 stop:551 length:141 start_codon:yes stop_codon:yes gene_type:complete
MKNIKDTKIFRFSETNTKVKILKVSNSSAFIDKLIEKNKNERIINE